jgi:short-chain fatty acids transporter
LVPVPVKNAAQEREGDSAVGFARLGMALADWSQRWFPDAFVFALAGLIVVFVTGALLGIAMRDLVKYFGEGFWSLIPFTMQMAIIIIGGYVVATSPPVHRLIRRLAGVPRTPRTAVAFVAFFSMATAMVSWGLSLIFSGVLVREVVRNVRGVDYRAIGAAAYLGTGSVWALGLSSSAALVMATPSAIPAALLKISGVIPLKETIYSWQSLTTAAILMFAGVVVAYLSAPDSTTKTAES